MKRLWGYVDHADNVRLDVVALLFVTQLKQSPKDCERLVREFMVAYLNIGDDPTDTVIRDNVWLFLLKHTKRAKMPEATLDVIWQQEVQKKETDRACTVS